MLLHFRATRAGWEREVSVRPSPRVAAASVLALTALLSSPPVRAQTPPTPTPTPLSQADVWVMPGAAPRPPSILPVRPPPTSAVPVAPAPKTASVPVRKPAAQSVPLPAARNAQASPESELLPFERPAPRPPSSARPSTGNVPGMAIAPAVSSVTRDYTFQPTPPVAAEKPAPEAKKPSETHFDLGVGTEVPISVGGLATLEVPHRILFQVGAGVMPAAYADAIDGVLTSVGAYDAVVSTVVRNSIANSFVLRTSIGLRPFEGHGFEVLGGYTLMTAGGSVATAEVLNAILIESGSSVQAPAGLGGDIPLSATLHNFHASLGWRWLLADDHLVIRASLSYFQTVGSSIQVKIPATATALVPYEGAINQQVNSYLGPYFSKYAKAPTLGLSAAFRF